MNKSSQGATNKCITCLHVYQAGDEHPCDTCKHGGGDSEADDNWEPMHATFVKRVAIESTSFEEINASIASEVAARHTPEAILRAAAGTYEERNAQYKDNFRNVGAVMSGLFPHGVNLKTPQHHEVYHLFELMIVKITRFANSNFTHKDSIHDAMVYAAMIESLHHQGGLE